MTAKGKSDIRLGRLELEIMNAVWDRGDATVRQVKDALAPRRKRAYSTILTMMRKLEEKGFLEHETRGRAYVYRAKVPRREVRRGLLGQLVDRLFDGSPGLLVTSLVEEEMMDEEELREIERLIGKGGKEK